MKLRSSPRGCLWGYLFSVWHRHAGGLVSASDLSVFCGGFYDGRIFPHEKAASGTAADFQV